MSIELSNYRTDFDRGAGRTRQFAWLVVQFLFFSLPCPLPSRVRVLLLRCFGAAVGHGVVIRSGVKVSFPWRLEVGDHTWIGEDVMILSLAQVTIGSSCCISQRAFLCTGSHRFDRPGFDLVTKPIEICNGSWVAAQAFVAPGVTVGRDSMCMAGSIVLKDVMPGTVVCGNPATVRSRD
ncbi:WcaF family extracellular polysaccharide biosynthesis acetyltransferase [Allorhodopirellula solitaria]|uniref:Galactoside O-acetyltransferase n=1 Tax=Allorhodopirellula solitaria TaxID=2527987 RepID=A0A5C5YEM4_9BACT|nr:WcaF family extracellular polysaccharide biosynthesis acetyltransferase [Allorhodopirellula solitaria]TWT72931.1 Galactoside O-acetyltransferase [Allorhodopirellula solitaria]